jgi:hypothetical protein
MHTLPKCWNTCMERNGDNIEKWSNCVPFVFNKLRDKKYLIFKVFIWLTKVFLATTFDFECLFYLLMGRVAQSV